MVIFRVILESFRQAFQELLGNRLRTFLSLLGITIGIFCIIGVQSAVDSLEANVKGSLQKLGDNVIYVQKMPWAEDPGENFWKYMKRPSPGYGDYEAIKNNSKTTEAADFHYFLGEKTLKYRQNSVENVFAIVVTQEFDDIFKPDYEKGRYYSPTEYNSGSKKVIIGHEVAENLFGAVDPIGKQIKMMGNNVEIIGVFKKSGDDLLKVMDFDKAVVMSYTFGSRFANMNVRDFWGRGSVNVKGKPNVSQDDLKDELTAILRVQRRIKPIEENSFALNSISILATILDGIFNALGMAGWFIGGFSILVGIFSVANIMFVSVKERTNIIGIKKALGAKKMVILSEFLIESVVLCLLGGAIGLFIIWAFLAAVRNVMPFDITLSMGNIIFGVSLSVFIGVLSGLIPAYQAANMDPVEAIRQ